MRTLLISLVIWVLIVPALVALFLIFTFIAAFVQDLYCATTSFALAFAVLTMLWGPFWLAPFSGSGGHPFQRNRQHPNSTQEKKCEQSFKGQVRS
jgi:hypothetical protein